MTNQAGTTDYGATRMIYAWNAQAMTFMVDETWTWDGVPGNCPTGYVPSGGREFRYDTARQRYFDRLFIFTYDKDWIRVPLGTTWTDYDGYQPYGDFMVQSEQAVNARSFELGTGTVDPWTGSGGGSTSHYHTDLIGTTRWMTDFNGSAASSAAYTAFGEQIRATNPRYGYAGAWGYQSHDEFPFLHVGARYYDPATGRFLQRDPIGIAGGLNVYAYVFNAPTRTTDPTGLKIGGLAGQKEGHAYAAGCGFTNWLLDSNFCLELKPMDEWPTVTDVTPPKRYPPLTRRWWSRPGRNPIFPGGACFVEGTVVHTEHGTMSIEDVGPGVMALTVETTSGEESYAAIAKVFSTWTKDLVHIGLPNETIHCTSEHPFWVVDCGWMKAGSLTPADTLLNADGQAVPILSIRFERLCEPLRIYNITVDGQHIYFVGESRIRVHNKM